MDPFVNSEIKNHIAHITFGTPKANSLPGYILEKLAQTIREEAAKPEVKAIFLKSAGDKVFCAGANFEELLAVKDLESSKTFFGGFAKVLNAMRTCGKITVVRVQGKTTGGGVGIACGADYCFATANAGMALTEINLGIGPFVIGPYVERKIGKSQYAAMAIDAEFRSAEWLKEKGVYHSVSNSIEEMDKKIDEFLFKLAGRSADALTAIKKAAWEGTDFIDQVTDERIYMSASLILADSAKENILKVKQMLNRKQ